MRLPIRTRVVLGIVAIFFAGAITGAFLGARVQMEAQTERAKIENLPESIMDMLDQRLELSDAQSELFRPLVAKACGELHDVYDRNYAEVGEIMGKYYKLMSKDLSKEQQETLIEMESVLRAKAGELNGRP